MPDSDFHRPFLILASSSPRRQKLLEQIGVIPDRIVAPNIDETPLKKETPRAYVLRLAQEKARAVSHRVNEEDEENEAQGGNNIILAADTAVALGRRILPAATDSSVQKELLHLLSGRRHCVLTGIAVMDHEGKIRVRLACAHVIFQRLGTKECEDYIESKEGLDKAGGYALQGHAASFVRYMSGHYSTVMGLPLYESRILLRSAGVRVR